MNLKKKISEDLIRSMKAKESFKVKTLRGLTANIKQVEVDTKKEVSEDQILSILQKQIKQRKESLAIYEDNDRQDLANVELQELNILEEYLPTQLSDEAVEAIVKKTIEDLKASSMKDMGKVMNKLRVDLSGQADPAKISALVKKNLV